MNFLGVLRHPEGKQVGLELKFSRGELGHVARVGLLRHGARGGGMRKNG